MAKKQDKTNGQRLVERWEKRLGEIASTLEDEFDIELFPNKEFYTKSGNGSDITTLGTRANHLANVAKAASEVLDLIDQVV